LPTQEAQPKLSLTWEVQHKPLSSLEVQCSIFKQPTEACLIDRVPDTEGCQSHYNKLQAGMHIPYKVTYAHVGAFNPVLTNGPTIPQSVPRGPCQLQIGSILPHTSKNAQGQCCSIK